MSDIREVTNPHDKIIIDCADMDAARAAVLCMGMDGTGSVAVACLFLF